MAIIVPAAGDVIDAALFGKPVADEINRMTPITTVTAWTNVAFLNGWSNQSAQLQGVQYRKIGDIVYIRGVAKPNASPSGQPAFVLPPGFRIPLDMQVSTGSYTSTWVLARFDVTASGNVVPIDGINPYYVFTCQFSVTP